MRVEYFTEQGEPCPASQAPYRALIDERTSRVLLDAKCGLRAYDWKSISEVGSVEEAHKAAIIYAFNMRAWWEAMKQ